MQSTLLFLHPVSYTHLDVYKRQVIALTIRLLKSTAVAPTIVIAVSVIAIVSITPVGSVIIPAVVSVPITGILTSLLLPGLVSALVRKLCALVAISVTAVYAVVISSVVTIIIPAIIIIVAIIPVSYTHLFGFRPHKIAGRAADLERRKWYERNIFFDLHKKTIHLN